MFPAQEYVCGIYLAVSVPAPLVPANSQILCDFTHLYDRTWKFFLMSMLILLIVLRFWK